MENIECHTLFIFYFKVKCLTQNFTINKQNIMKPKYKQYLYCFIICMVVPHAVWFSYQQNIITILTSPTFRGEALVIGRRLFQYGHSKMQCLLEGGAYMRPGVYQRKYGMHIWFKVNCKVTRIRLIDVRYIYNKYLLFLLFTWNMHSSSSLVLY